MRERQRERKRKKREKRSEREGERQLEHQRLPTKSSRSAWLKLTINYTAQQANQFSCSHMNSSFVSVVQPCCTVLANNSNWQIEPPIGQLAAQLRPRIAARFGIRIDKAAFNCRNDRQRAKEMERDSAAAPLLIGIPTQRAQVAGLINCVCARVCVLSKRMLNACDKDVTALHPT